MIEAELMQTLIVKTTDRQLLKLDNSGLEPEVLLSQDKMPTDEWLQLFAASPALFAQVVCADQFLENLKPICHPTLVLQIELMQNALRQAKRLALGETLATDKKLS